MFPKSVFAMFAILLPSSMQLSIDPSFLDDILKYEDHDTFRKVMSGSRSWYKVPGSHPENENKFPHFLWPKRIPYYISPSFGKYGSRNMIMDAIVEFNREFADCLLWVPYILGDETYVYFTKGKSCKAKLGSQGRPQILEFDEFVCMCPRTLLSEMLYTVGIMYEHRRPDRNNYIKINWENIDPYFHDEFKMVNEMELLGPYDYYSVTHHSRTAYNKTMRPYQNIFDLLVNRKEVFQQQIGQSERLSTLDKLKVRRLYGCKVNDFDNEL